jgi:molybdopterin-guanine dinucleotide biosynthesis protein
MVTFPVTCTNGLSGVGKATYETPRAGGGEIVMQDGTRWQFIFGRSALGV